MMTKNKVIVGGIAVVALGAVFIWGSGLGGNLASRIIRSARSITQTAQPQMQPVRPPTTQPVATNGSGSISGSGYGSEYGYGTNACPPTTTTDTTNISTTITPAEFEKQFRRHMGNPPELQPKYIETDKLCGGISQRLRDEILAERRAAAQNS